MITYQYGPWNPEDDNEYTPDKIMSLLSDLVMKYDISIEEALRHLISQGMPVNLFLKQGGMDDLVKKYADSIQQQIDDILGKYDPSSLQEKLEKELTMLEQDLLKSLDKKPELHESVKKLIADGNQDALRRLQWDKSAKGIAGKLSAWLEAGDRVTKIANGLKKYTFTGSEIPTPAELAAILKTLKDLNALVAALKDAIESGDLYNFNLEKIAQYLGAESYQEFLETRDKIFDQIKELLEKQGMVQQSGSEEGGLELTPAAIRKIGRRTLAEIFAVMKADASSGSHTTREYGESENITSTVKPYEFGDNLSHIDYPGSIVNSVMNGRGGKPGLNDLDVHLSIGSATSSTVILLDMSGSMYRYNRFYNAKKVCMAMDALIREDFKDDKLTIIGFGSTTRIIPLAEMPLLQPYPVTIYDPHIRMVYDFARLNRKQLDQIPMYFTNLQKGLQTARQVLSGKQNSNKNIILITDGVPTAHFEGSKLHLNYPPVPADFEEALNEVKKCRDDQVVINTFLLTSDWDEFYVGGESFIQKFAKISKGRFFHPHPTDLNKMILYDFIRNRKSQIEY